MLNQRCSVENVTRNKSIASHVLTPLSTVRKIVWRHRPLVYWARPLLTLTLLSPFSGGGGWEMADWLDRLTQTQIFELAPETWSNQWNCRVKFIVEARPSTSIKVIVWDSFRPICNSKSSISALAFTGPMIQACAITFLWEAQLGSGQETRRLIRKRIDPVSDAQLSLSEWLCICTMVHSDLVSLNA